MNAQLTARPAAPAALRHGRRAPRTPHPSRGRPVAAPGVSGIARRRRARRRADRLFARRLKQAGLTTEKTLADFDWAFNPKLPKATIAELATARFVATHANLLLIGPPGVGKSHIATAIAIGAIRAGRRALVRSTFDLAADFAQADATGTRRELVQQLTRVDLLVLEDFG